MLIESFHDYVASNCQDTARTMFSGFFESWLQSFDREDDAIEDLAWQMYQMQVCMEGILEDVHG